MHITLSPQRRDETLILTRTGDTLTLNGQALDLSVIPEGATIPAEAIDSPWICGPITREAGVLHLHLLLPHGPIPHPAPPEADAVRFPQPITVTGNGPITLPRYTQ